MSGHLLLRITHFTFASLLLAAVVPPAVAEPDSSDSLLRTRLDQILTGHKQPKVQLGARVIELPSGRIVYDRDGHRPMMPASNMKLVVMAAAIDQLGKDYEFKTVLAIRGKDLVIIGGGDPTFGDERLAEQRRESITAVFHEWARNLKTAGVKRVSGNIVIDDSVFEKQFVHPRWPADQIQNWYEACIGGLNFNANCTTVRVRPTSSGKAAEVSLVPGNDGLQIINKTVTGAKQSASVTRQKDGALVVSGTSAKEVLLGPVTVPDPGM